MSRTWALLTATVLLILPFTEAERSRLLLATESGVKFLAEKRTKVGDFTGSVASVAYVHSRQEIYYIANNTIYRLPYLPDQMKIDSATVVIEETEPLVDLAIDLAADRVLYVKESGQVYFVAFNRSAKEFEELNKTMGKLMTFDPPARDIAYEPWERFVLAAQNDKLSLRSIKYLFGHSFGSCYVESFVNKSCTYKINATYNAVAVDYGKQIMYTAMANTTLSGDVGCLTSITYNATTFAVIHTGAEFSNPFSLDVFNDQVFWGNLEDQWYKIYKGKISSEGRLENITVVYEDLQKINKIRIYDPEIQAHAPEASTPEAGA